MDCSPSRLILPRGTQSRVTDYRARFRVTNEIARWNGTLQRGDFSLGLGARVHIGDPDRTAIIELPKDIKAELHKFRRTPIAFMAISSEVDTCLGVKVVGKNQGVCSILNRRTKERRVEGGAIVNAELQNGFGSVPCPTERR
jgi:hypothetical protein